MFRTAELQRRIGNRTTCDTGITFKAIIKCEFSKLQLKHYESPLSSFAGEVGRSFHGWIRG